MLKYFARQLLLSIPTILILTFFVFGIIYLIPGDPAQSLLGQTASPEAIEAFREKMGLDKPFIIQYLTWLGRVLRGDLGNSVRTWEPVGPAVVSRLPVTLQLAVYSLIIAALIGVPIGALAAVRRNTIWDLVAQVIGLVGLSTPGFFLAILCILFFTLRLGWLPVAGYVSPLEDPLRSMRAMLMPAFSLGFGMAGSLSRVTRSAVIDTLSQDYVRTARAKGLVERMVLLRHVLKNAMIPVATMTGLLFGFALGGTIIIESIFSLPGMGRLMIQNIYGQDFPMVQGVLLFLVVVRLVVNLVTDFAYALLDPKVRLGD
jgi:peptide/nickel transport system permease protein